MPAILDWQSDVKPFLGIECCDANEGLVKSLMRQVESQARKYVGHCIAQETITGEIHRRDDIGIYCDAATIEVVGDAVYLDQRGSIGGDILQLDNGFVRSITTAHEDPSAEFGQGASDFGAATLLTSGTEYALELDKWSVSGSLSKSGRLRRINRDWSSKPGTIKVTYVAGLTATELSNEYAFVKLALLTDLQEKFNYILSRRGVGGAIKRESFAGDYSVEYQETNSVIIGQLSQTARQMLTPITRLPL